MNNSTKLKRRFLRTIYMLNNIHKCFPHFWSLRPCSDWEIKFWHLRSIGIFGVFLAPNILEKRLKFSVNKVMIFFLFFFWNSPQKPFLLCSSAITTTTDTGECENHAKFMSHSPDFMSHSPDPHILSISYPAPPTCFITNCRNVRKKNHLRITYTTPSKFWKAT